MVMTMSCGTITSKNVIAAVQVSQIPDKEVPQEAQRTGLAPSHRLKQGPQVRTSVPLVSDSSQYGS